MTTSQDSGLQRGIRVRKPRLDFDDASIPCYWFKNNPVVTHGFNAFNLVIPDFERFFVRSVMRLRGCVNDPVLRNRIKVFAGQESMHAQAHENYFELMKKQGYKIDRYLHLCKKYGALSERMGTRSLNIASTAAAEHYTSTIATLVLSQPSLLAGMHPTMRRFLVWHSAEEIEHRAVAFDVMQAVGVSYFVRILAYIIVSFDILLWTTLGSLMLLRQDGLSIRKIFFYKRKFRKEFADLPRESRRLLLAYFRKDFHPEQTAIPPITHAELSNLDDACDKSDLKECVGAQE